MLFLNYILSKMKHVYLLFLQSANESARLKLSCEEEVVFKSDAGNLGV